jgi:hypothetical protein
MWLNSLQCEVKFATQNTNLYLYSFYFCPVITSEAETLKNTGRQKPATFVFLTVTMPLKKGQPS